MVDHVKVRDLFFSTSPHIAHTHVKQSHVYESLLLLGRARGPMRSWVTSHACDVAIISRAHPQPSMTLGRLRPFDPRWRFVFSRAFNSLLQFIICLYPRRLRSHCFLQVIKSSNVNQTSLFTNFDNPDLNFMGLAG